ncbi:hypothetical protein BASA82_000237 [Batrachochytrium salamandrivorans]|nr:hypothetical protein BASA82_000237 [Batrachochytrium salamandrivorans]
MPANRACPQTLGEEVGRIRRLVESRAWRSTTWSFWRSAQVAKYPREAPPRHPEHNRQGGAKLGVWPPRCNKSLPPTKSTNFSPHG